MATRITTYPKLSPWACLTDDEKLAWIAEHGFFDNAPTGPFTTYEIVKALCAKVLELERLLKPCA